MPKDQWDNPKQLKAILRKDKINVLPDESVRVAEQCLCEAVKIAQDQHATMLELRAATSLARLWKMLNKSDEATRILQPVYARFNEGVDSLELSEAKAVLAQLRV